MAQPTQQNYQPVGRRQDQALISVIDIIRNSSETKYVLIIGAAQWEYNMLRIYWPSSPDPTPIHTHTHTPLVINNNLISQIFVSYSEVTTQTWIVKVSTQALDQMVSLSSSRSCSVWPKWMHYNTSNLKTSSALWNESTDDWRRFNGRLPQNDAAFL